jgi:hypothetical protein
MNKFRVSLAAFLVALLPLWAPPVLGAQGAAPPAGDAGWVRSDAALHTVSLRLDVTRPPGAPSALLSGARGGQVQVVVPLGWTVEWDWSSHDSTSPHSLVVMAEREKIPAEGGRPAFDNAMTRMVTAGLPPGQRDLTTFVADQPGWYWLLCGVPGHALEGEYIGLRVDPGATEGGVNRTGNREQ